MVYEPREDSFLLLRNIANYAKKVGPDGLILDVGTGSGILAKEAAQSSKVKKLYASDIDTGAIDYCRKAIKDRTIKFVRGDLFEYFRNNRNNGAKNEEKRGEGENRKNKGLTNSPAFKFDLVIFNPPYLPDDPNARDVALDGGRHGYEILGRFIGDLPAFLKDDGTCLLLFSSLSKKDKVLGFISEQALSARLIDSMKLDFEELYVYEVKKSSIRLEMEQSGITDIYYLAKGKRGVVFRGKMNGKTVAVKTKNPDSQAIGRIRNEMEMLKLVNNKGIGPKLVMATDNLVAYEYFEGLRFEDHIKKNSKEGVTRAVKEIFHQLSVLDEMGLNKAEMARPIKHILVGKKLPGKPANVMLIDFERAHHTEKPQNITQFCNYLISDRLYLILKEKGFSYDKDELKVLAQNYAVEIKHGKHLSAQKLIERIVRKVIG